MAHPNKTPTHTTSEIFAALLHPAVIVGALGYFVDIYDLVLFGVVRVNSLKDLGYTGEELATNGAWLFNWQMGGMLLGGILWGLLGDRFGRLKVLFGSIILYSLANIANAFVHDLGAYTACRFVAGIGLAGELGGSITLVSEVLPRTLRGYGTMMVSAVGVLGAVAAGLAANYYPAFFGIAVWRQLYVIGGILGFLLLFLRVFVSESGLYKTMEGTNRPTFASQLGLILAPQRIGRYICCIMIGLPTWYVVGLLVLFSPEFGVALGATGKIVAGTALAWTYGGICAGDVASNILSQFARSRKNVLLGFIISACILSGVFLGLHQPSPTNVYAICFILGISVGYWSVYVTVAAEHFGTNMRATVATTVPNFTRGAVIPITNFFLLLKAYHYPAVTSAIIVGTMAFMLALIGVGGLRETFDDDLDYLEK